ncbi:MAG TPA: hypothetical protein VEA69_12360 [Tepidisphaeraceae bacterium]|nr:hypothetical protein [Tepidisphaeraceae bacterium]
MTPETIDTVRKALEFYADRHNYDANGSPEVDHTADWGDIARAALLALAEDGATKPLAWKDRPRGGGTEGRNSTEQPEPTRNQ